MAICQKLVTHRQRKLYTQRFFAKCAGGRRYITSSSRFADARYAQVVRKCLFAVRQPTMARLSAGKVSWATLGRQFAQGTCSWLFPDGSQPGSYLEWSTPVTGCRLVGLQPFAKSGHRSDQYRWYYRGQRRQFLPATSANHCVDFTLALPLNLFADSSPQRTIGLKRKRWGLAPSSPRRRFLSASYSW